VKRIFAFLPVAALLAAAQPALADPGHRHHRPTFSELDADGDGSVTQDEFLTPVVEHLTERFNAIDTNGDGVVSEAEFEAAKPPHARGSQAQ